MMKRTIALTLVMLIVGVAFSGAGTVVADDRSSVEAGPTNTTTNDGSPDEPSVERNKNTVIDLPIEKPKVNPPESPNGIDRGSVTVNPPGEGENRTIVIDTGGTED